MSGGGIDALAAEVEGLTRHAPQNLDGRAVEATLTPTSTEAVSLALSALGRLDLVAVPRGAGTQLHVGNPPERVDCFLATAGLAGVEELEPADGVCRAAAGTPLGVLRRAAEEEGVEIPLEGPDAATVGGALASARVGPRSHGFGRARDAVLGLDVVLGSGEATRCGGRVVKNVTGYDLAKLYTGSLGSLGVVTAAWLRTRPLPAARELRVRRFEGLDPALAPALDAARRSTARVCALRWGAEGVSLLVELGGDAAAVARDAGEVGGEPAEAADVDAVAAFQWRADVGLGVRIAVLPAELEKVMTGLREAGARLLAYPGPGLVYAHFDGEDAVRGLEAALRAARAASGPLRIEVAPAAVKRERCVFGAREEEVALFRALKQRFDPAGALSRGRFAGRL